MKAALEEPVKDIESPQTFIRRPFILESPQDSLTDFISRASRRRVKCVPVHFVTEAAREKAVVKDERRRVGRGKKRVKEMWVLTCSLNWS